MGTRFSAITQSFFCNFDEILHCLKVELQETIVHRFFTRNRGYDVFADFKYFDCKPYDYHISKPDRKVSPMVEFNLQTHMSRNQIFEIFKGKVPLPSLKLNRHITTEARDDTSVTEEVWEDLKDNEKYNDPDSLTFKQILHMDRHADIIDLAYRNKF